MDNAAFISASYNDAVTRENLRTLGLLVNAANTNQVNREENQEENTDILELSNEFQEIVQTDAAVQTVNTEETVAGITENGTEVGTGLENAAETPAAEQLIAEGEVENQINFITELTEPAAEELEAEPSEEDLVAAGVVPAAVETQTAEGSVAREPELTIARAPAAEEVPEETVSPLEEQMNEVIRINEILNSASGLTGAGPVTDVERAAQTRQYQEQVLLQNVGTQLAQVIPPSSIISVLG